MSHITISRPDTTRADPKQIRHTQTLNHI